MSSFIKDSIKFILGHYEEYNNLLPNVELLELIEKEYTKIGCFYSFVEPKNNGDSIILSDGFFACNEEKDLLVDLILYIENDKIECLEVMNVLGNFPVKDPTVYKFKKASVNIIDDFENNYDS